MEMIEYEQQDYDVAKKYYILRLRTFDPTTGTHL